tara:strand:- start:948 stop:1463 length:516 start_codon:yes stop_codon:yes gene_type:complete
MAIGTQKILRGNQGGHAGFVTATIDEKELNSLVKTIDSLGFTERKEKTLLRQALRKAAKPILTQLKTNVQTMIKPTMAGAVSKKTGQLKKSLAVINGKIKSGVSPSVFVGPRVKNTFANEDKTGFYFFFFEYGFYGRSGLRMLDDASQKEGNNALTSVVDHLKKIIEKKFK